MRRFKTASLALLFVGLFLSAACSSQPESQAPQATTATVFEEGARLIVGDGSAPIEDAAFVVEKIRSPQVGRKGQVRTGRAQRVWT